MSTSSWPPKAGLSTPTVPRKDATFSISASTRINAPASVVFDIVLQVSEYPKWNTFVPEVRINSQPEGRKADTSRLYEGTTFDFMVVMNASKPSSKTQTGLQVSDISTPEKQSSYISKEDLEKDPGFTADLSKVYRIAWKQHGGFASGGLKTERFHEIIILGENECEVRTWEVMGGLLARTVKWMFEKTLNEKFQLWNADLKKYAELQVSAGSAA